MVSVRHGSAKGRYCVVAETADRGGPGPAAATRPSPVAGHRAWPAPRRSPEPTWHRAKGTHAVIKRRLRAEDGRRGAEGRPGSPRGRRPGRRNAVRPVARAGVRADRGRAGGRAASRLAAAGGGAGRWRTAARPGAGRADTMGRSRERSGERAGERRRPRRRDGPGRAARAVPARGGPGGAAVERPSSRRRHGGAGPRVGRPRSRGRGVRRGTREPGAGPVVRRVRARPVRPGPVRLFFQVTGQAGQYRAMDPDGSLLAVAYAAATAAERAHARAAMLAAGDFRSSPAAIAVRASANCPTRNSVTSPNGTPSSENGTNRGRSSRICPSARAWSWCACSTRGGRRATTPVAACSPCCARRSRRTGRPRITGARPGRQGVRVAADGRRCDARRPSRFRTAGRARRGELAIRRCRSWPGPDRPVQNVGRYTGRDDDIEL